MLKEEIDEAKRSVTTDTVSITVGEIANMYAQQELNIIPDFQRLFRWTPERKSNFIESILIGIPIPPAFAYENEDGTWELIDGLQRVSTILEFMGLLKDPDDESIRRSRLMKTKYLPSLEGVVWEPGGEPVSDEVYERPEDDDLLTDFEDAAIAVDAAVAVEAEEGEPGEGDTPEERGLDRPLQLFFRRHRIDFQILKYPSDPKTKFDLFQRLNRGGAYANEQEVRTCSMVLANAPFTARLRSLSAEQVFQEIFRVTEAQRKTQKDLEYAVRVVVHTYEEYVQGKDVQEFLDQAILKIMQERDPVEVLETVGWSIRTLHRIFGSNALIPPDNRPAGIAKKFSLRALEGIVVGIARNRAAIEALDDTDAFIAAKVDGFWQQPQIQTMAAPGLRGTVRLKRSVEFGAEWFAPNA